MAQLPQSHLRLADLSNQNATAFDITPTAPERQAIAAALNISGVKKLRFSGQLAPVGRSDWALTANLGATVVQPCVATLAPVTTRIDEPVRRSYIADLPEIDAAEAEMPEDDTVEPLPASLDLAAIMIEALTLALPLYPRSADAPLAAAASAPPGITPMSDEDAKPFAALGALREKLENKEE
ncbi:DUF177 domain-containing protein [Yoonia sp. BS5-3]|uniref:DUF177 domain-containing protein n=1 Tax=Yoonia phaeophyticola TaxID=3137369 RepID=A0ABZ2V2N5_9RHOB